MKNEELNPFLLAELLEETEKATEKAVKEAMHLLRQERNMQPEKYKTLRTIGNVIYTTSETFL